MTNTIIGWKSGYCDYTTIGKQVLYIGEQPVMFRGNKGFTINDRGEVTTGWLDKATFLSNRSTALFLHSYVGFWPTGDLAFGWLAKDQKISANGLVLNLLSNSKVEFDQEGRLEECVARSIHCNIGGWNKNIDIPLATNINLNKDAHVNNLVFVDGKIARFILGSDMTFPNFGHPIKPGANAEIDVYSGCIGLIKPAVRFGEVVIKGHKIVINAFDGIELYRNGSIKSITPANHYFRYPVSETERDLVGKILFYPDGSLRYAQFADPQFFYAGDQIVGYATYNVYELYPDGKIRSYHLGNKIIFTNQGNIIQINPGYIYFYPDGHLKKFDNAMPYTNITGERTNVFSAGEMVLYPDGKLKSGTLMQDAIFEFSTIDSGDTPKGGLVTLRAGNKVFLDPKGKMYGFSDITEPDQILTTMIGQDPEPWQLEMIRYKNGANGEVDSYAFKLSNHGSIPWKLQLIDPDYLSETTVWVRFGVCRSERDFDILEAMFSEDLEVDVNGKRVTFKAFQWVPVNISYRPVDFGER